MSSRQMLIVDDEEEIRNALSRHFRFLGYEVATAADGKEALDVLAQRHTDVIVSDIVMPRMNGVDLLRAVRKEYPMARFIVMSAYVNQEYLMACMRHGAETCIFKPWTDLREMEQAVSRAFRSLAVWKKKLHTLIRMKPQE